jgi:membrane-bound acyltransferase YfiQ involved in biofilm formation
VTHLICSFVDHLVQFSSAADPGHNGNFILNVYLFRYRSGFIFIILTFLCFMFCVNVKEFPHDMT